MRESNPNDMTIGGPHTNRLQPTCWSSPTESEAPRVSLAWVSRPRAGESVNGDAVVVRKHGSSVLIAVIDALGHGPKAAEVAQTSVKWLDSADEPTGATGLVNGLHRELQGSRGTAALLLLVSATGLEACSVGNVELRSTTGRLPFVLTPGVLGVRLRSPKICVSGSPLSDRFVLHSDGISGRFDIKPPRSQTPSELVSHIFASHRHSHDDATVMVVDVEYPAAGTTPGDPSEPRARSAPRTT